MVIKKGTPREVLLHLFRNPSSSHTITTLTEELKRSRVGIWKTVKSLEKENYLVLSPIKLLKKKVYIVSINWDNILVEKTFGMYLIGESLNYEEWTKNFKNLGNVLDFLILCKEDEKDKILGVTQKGKFIRIQKPANLKDNGKEIITASITNVDFSQGLKNKKEEYIYAVKHGVILFGQENFIQFIKNFQHSQF
jgi:biotin operon repressor